MSRVGINNTNNKDGINRCHQQDTHSDDILYVEI